MSSIISLKDKVNSDFIDKLKGYSAYCTDKTKDRWNAELETIAERIEALPNLEVYEKTLYEDDKLYTYQFTGSYMEDISNGATFDEIRLKFGQQDFSSEQTYMMCRNFLIYTSNGFELVEKIFEREKMPPIVERMYNDAKRDKKLLQKWDTIIEARDLCFDCKTSDWDDIVLRAFDKEDKHKEHSNGKESLNEALVISNLAIMINRHEPWDKIIEYFKSLELSEKAQKLFCLDMIYNFPCGYHFAMHLYGNNIPDEIFSLLKEKENDIILKLEVKGELRTTLDDCHLAYEIYNLPDSFQGVSYEIKPGIYKRTLFSDFKERKALYEDLTNAEMKTGTNGADYQRLFTNLQARRIEMNKILEMVKDNPEPFIIDSLGDHYDERDKFELFFARFIRVYHAIPEQTDKSKEMKPYEFDLRTGFEKQACAVLEELHGRATVEEIDAYLANSSLEDGLRKYLITKKNQILYEHPEVENWYLQIAFFGEEELLGDYEPRTVPILKHYHCTFGPIYYALSSIKKEILNDYKRAVVRGDNNDYKQVYSGLRVSALRRFLGDGDNLLLDSDVNIPSYSTRVTERAKELLLSRQYQNKQVMVHKYEEQKED